MPCNECIPNLPERLCSDGKESPLPFVPEEIIFRRHTLPGGLEQLQALSESALGNEVFQLKSDSYNRSSLSELNDVLINHSPDEQKGADYYDHWGIISLNVQSVNQISAPMRINDEVKNCTLRVVHTADPCNYSHCEIFLFIDDERYYEKAQKSARILFRQQLQKILNVEKQYVAN